MSEQTKPITRKAHHETFDLTSAPLRVGLRYHAGERNGQARRCQRQKYIINIVCRVEKRVPVVAEYVSKRNFVYSAEYFHNYDAECKYSGSVQIILIF